MAHSANRSIDFAPAWLKLPEQSQEPKRQEPHYNNHPNHYNSPSHHRNSIGHSSHYHHQGHNSNPHHHPQQYHHGAQQYPNQQVGQSSYPNPANNHHQNHQPHHNNGGGVGGSSHRTGRPPLNSYHSTYNGRSSSQPIQLHRSQSTGSYNETSRVTPNNVNQSNLATAAKPKPLEEEFPVLGNASTASQTNNQVNNTAAQWRIKERSKDEPKTPTQQQSDNLLTSNMTGKVYRAQVKPVKRSNMIPITNGTSGITIRTRENGDHSGHIAKENSCLSSSLDREKRFLQELGWNENEESDDDCIIPEQDPAELQQIMMQAKAARERLLMKSKQNMKPVLPVTAAALPNEDDIPSSSDNSDAE